jgi:hypothetical protein
MVGPGAVMPRNCSCRGENAFVVAYVQLSPTAVHSPACFSVLSHSCPAFPVAWPYIRLVVTLLKMNDD